MLFLRGPTGAIQALAVISVLLVTGCNGKDTDLVARTRGSLDT